MEFLTTNLQPLKTGNATYPSSWLRDFKMAKSVVLATGYVSIEALVHLRQSLTENSATSFTLIVGMAMRDGLTAGQLKELGEIHETLVAQNRGGVRIVTTFAFHGKTSLFTSKSDELTAYVGSSNLSGIVPIGNDASRTYEIDLRLSEAATVDGVKDFLNELSTKNSRPLLEVISEIHIVQGVNQAAASATETRYFGSDEFELLRHNHSIGDPIRIGISTASKSSLNDCFGFRKAKSGKLIPRPWYEVQLIVSKGDRTSSVHYPVKCEFFVITDDGFEFVGKTSGDDGKNLSSRGDNRIFGRWIKGKLEEAGVLSFKERATTNTLRAYGNSFLTLQKTEITKYDEKSKMKLPVYIFSFLRDAG
jgi:hypothetical protein